MNAYVLFCSVHSTLSGFAIFSPPFSLNHRHRRRRSCCKHHYPLLLMSLVSMPQTSCSITIPSSAVAAHSFYLITSCLPAFSQRISALSSLSLSLSTLHRFNLVAVSPKLFNAVGCYCRRHSSRPYPTTKSICSLRPTSLRTRNDGDP